MTQEEKDRLEMEKIQIQIELFKQFWQRLLKQGVLVTAQFIAIGALSYAVVWLHNHSTDEIDALRVEYKADLAEARNETRLCEQERLRQAAVFNEKIQAIQETVQRAILKKK